MHSTTKYINGHSDVIGGAVITSDEAILTKLKFWANNLGITGSPFDSYLTLRGLRTLGIRMEKHEKNAQAIVEILSNNAKVKSVFYPGLAHHPSHEIAKKQQSGFGGMLSFELKEGLTGVKKFIEKYSDYIKWIRSFKSRSKNFPENNKSPCKDNDMKKWCMQQNGPICKYAFDNGYAETHHFLPDKEIIYTSFGFDPQFKTMYKIKQHRPKYFCINDSFNNSLEDRIKFFNKINHFLESYFPEKPFFEN